MHALPPHRDKREINRENPIGLKGELAEQFGSLITTLWCGRYLSTLQYPCVRYLSTPQYPCVYTRGLPEYDEYSSGLRVSVKGSASPPQELGCLAAVSRIASSLGSVC
jgi:hypothetical protein